MRRIALVLLATLVVLVLCLPAIADSPSRYHREEDLGQADREREIERIGEEKASKAQREWEHQYQAKRKPTNDEPHSRHTREPGQQRHEQESVIKHRGAKHGHDPHSEKAKERANEAKGNNHYYQIFEDSDNDIDNDIDNDSASEVKPVGRYNQTTDGSRNQTSPFHNRDPQARRFPHTQQPGPIRNVTDRGSDGEGGAVGSDGYSPEQYNRSSPISYPPPIPSMNPKQSYPYHSQYNYTDTPQPPANNDIDSEGDYDSEEGKDMKVPAEPLPAHNLYAKRSTSTDAGHSHDEFEDTDPATSNQTIQDADEVQEPGNNVEVDDEGESEENEEGVYRHDVYRAPKQHHRRDDSEGASNIVEPIRDRNNGGHQLRDEPRAHDKHHHSSHSSKHHHGHSDRNNGRHQINSEPRRGRDSDGNRALVDETEIDWEFNHANAGNTDHSTQTRNATDSDYVLDPSSSTAAFENLTASTVYGSDASSSLSAMFLVFLLLSVAVYGMHYCYQYYSRRSQYALIDRRDSHGKYSNGGSTSVYEDDVYSDLESDSLQPTPKLQARVF